MAVNIHGHDSSDRMVPVRVDSQGRLIVVTGAGDSQVYVDETDPNGVYVGYSAPGTLTSAALWQIFKVIVVGVLTTVKYADSDSSFVKSWDLRATYVY